MAKKLIFLLIVLSFFLAGCADKPEKTLNLALEQNDSRICEETGNQPFYREYCYTRFALKNKDVSFCYNIYSLSKRGECIRSLAFLIYDIDLCDEIEDEVEKTKCLAAFYIDNKSIELCDTLPYKGFKDTNTYIENCKDQINMKLAIINDNITKCQLIEDSFLFENCVGFFKVGRNESVCDELLPIAPRENWSEELKKEKAQKQIEICREPDISLNLFLIACDEEIMNSIIGTEREEIFKKILPECESFS